jgi:hypothetical protein
MILSISASKVAGIIGMGHHTAPRGLDILKKVTCKVKSESLEMGILSTSVIS